MGHRIGLGSAGTTVASEAVTGLATRLAGRADAPVLAGASQRWPSWTRGRTTWHTDAGRACAQAALRTLGRREDLPPRRPGAPPVWPAGTVGSISHGSALAIAVAAAVTDFEALGVDVEDDRVERSLVDVIASPSERRRLGAAGAEEIERALALRFSAKEALYKALPAEVGDLLDMTDVAIRLDGAGSFAGRPDGRRQACTPELVDLLARTTGVWIVLAGAVVTFAWRPAPAGSARACRARIAVSACSSEPPR